MPIVADAPVLAIRADGGVGIGAGHVMRSVALADAWRHGGGRVEWFCRPLPAMLQGLLDTRAITTHAMDGGWPDVERWAAAHPGAWVCVDGYGFADGPARLRSAGARVLVIDDDGRWGRYECDVLLNQTVGAERLQYETVVGATRLLGSQYCLLRSEFLARGPAPARVGPVRRVFVAFGGHDAHQQTARVVPLLRSRWPEAQIDVAAGLMPGAPARPAEPRVSSLTGTDLSAAMREADLAIVAAGSICWELAFLGVPALTFTVADNQELIAHGVQEAGAARSLGWFDRVSDGEIVAALEALSDGAERSAMSRRARALVDGRGGSRVVAVMRSAAA